ncbi:MAG: 4Fe-4S binding protein [Candidatus Sumerlaeia bacterium]|nr:4Fe-4S binding protein [Candidatus Sumerlaeia bacterium]
MQQEKEKTREKYLWLNKRWCKRCGICAAVCPKNVIDYDHEGYPVFARMDACIYCLNCVLYCPDYAIFDSKEDQDYAKSIL